MTSAFPSSGILTTNLSCNNLVFSSPSLISLLTRTDPLSHCSPSLDFGFTLKLLTPVLATLPSSGSQPHSKIHYKLNPARFYSSLPNTDSVCSNRPSPELCSASPPRLAVHL
uniref:Uncharacterized protein n=1 Tax=Nothobranchius rachovii TaxID=451742 RepID=A0A1A8PGC9_9TELE